MKRALLAVTMLAAFACHKGILQPQMEVKDGSFTKPSTTIGQAPAKVWSDTTYEAAVNKMPLPGSVITLTGEIIDISCYLQLGKHGAAHKDCAQKCMRNGNPIGLLDENGGVHLLMAEEHHPRRDGKTESLREILIDKAGSIVTVTGTCSLVNGYCGIYISGFVK